MRETVAAYREAMRQFAGMRVLDVWYSRLDIDELAAELQSQMKKRMTKRLEQTLAKARTRDSMKAFSKLTQMVDGEPQIVSDPPLIERVHDLAPGREGERTREGGTRTPARVSPVASDRSANLAGRVSDG